MISTGDTTTNNTLIQIGIVDSASDTATDITDMINDITYTVIDSTTDDTDNSHNKLP